MTNEARIQNIDLNVARLGKNLNKVVAQNQEFQNQFAVILKNQQSIIANQRIILDQIEKLKGL